jgi:hypothetical protein
MRLPSHDRPTPPLPAALDRCPRLVGREFSGTRGRSAASFRQAAIPLHQNGGRHLRPHRPQRSQHWISRTWCGRLWRHRADDRPRHRLPSAIYRPASRWTAMSNFWLGQCGRCGRSRPDVFWRGRQAQPAREGTRRVRSTLGLSLRSRGNRTSGVASFSRLSAASHSRLNARPRLPDQKSAAC